MTGIDFQKKKKIMENKQVSFKINLAEFDNF